MVSRVEVLLAEALGVCLNATFVLLGHLPPVARFKKKKKRGDSRQLKNVVRNGLTP